MKPAIGQFDDAPTDEEMSHVHQIPVALAQPVDPHRHAISKREPCHDSLRKNLDPKPEAKKAEKNSKKFLKVAATVNENDVLCGRGKGSNDHTGNQRFRDIVKDYRYAYHVSRDRREKAHICRTIIGRIKNQTPSGRFLKKEKIGGKEVWCCIDEGRTMLKTGQALREGRTKGVIPTPTDASLYNQTNSLLVLKNLRESLQAPGIAARMN